jgi:hypothetical protein
METSNDGSKNPMPEDAQKVFDTVTGPNLRRTDNLIQLAVIAAGALLGAGIGAGWSYYHGLGSFPPGQVFAWDRCEKCGLPSLVHTLRPLTLFFMGGFIGVVASLLLSGGVIGVVRLIRARK